MASSPAHSLRLAVLAAALLLAVGGGVTAFVLWPEGQPVAMVAEAFWRQWGERLGVLDRPATVRTRPPGNQREALVDLGVYPGVDGELDVRLAQELLAMMDRTPGLERYAVVVRIGVVRHALTAEMLGNALIRISGEQGGEPIRTIYKGYVQHRLQAAAYGGSLAQTPQGGDAAPIP